jgi:hypothetical protein
MSLSIGVPSALMRGDVIVIVYDLQPCSLAKVRASCLVCFGAIDLTFIACVVYRKYPYHIDTIDIS